MIRTLLLHTLLLAALHAAAQNAATTTLPAPGIITGDGVRLRAEASRKGKELAKLNTGDNINILRLTSRRDGLGSAEVCDSFYWAYIETAARQRGWVYGKFVGALETGGELLPAQTQFTLGANTYSLETCRDFGIGSWNWEGLTGCEDFHLLAIRDATSGKVSPVLALTNNMIVYKNARFARLDTNDGVNESVKNIRVNDGRLFLDMRVEYQDGSGTYTLEITQKDGQWKGWAFDFKDD